MQSLILRKLLLIIALVITLAVVIVWLSIDLFAASYFSFLMEKYGLPKDEVRGARHIPRSGPPLHHLGRTPSRINSTRLRPVRVQFAAQEIAVDTQFADGVDEVPADPDKLQQVVHNLLQNIWQYMLPGTESSTDETRIWFTVPR